ncbi:30S ribosomal protein S9 [Desulfobacterium sp. N47]|uniref:Small ribosomal subunit protein uS9 n=1 Tax=uncultured Desulfobacterium sp. TaxID=201089 RepID=E1Y8S4_9BACT|nr:30S ribosomal protein S9 [uncultured Desulfobacterium sp.]
MEKQNVFYATGRRKKAIAKAWMKPGTGLVIINDLPIEQYFKVESARIDLIKPFVITNTLGTFDVKVRVLGGGISGQSGAVRLGITRALMLSNPDLRQVLKKAGFVKRDPRIKERKKYGQRGARARYQFSKR